MLDNNMLSQGLIYLLVICFSFVRLRSYLHYFQQEEYDSKRFAVWLYTKRAWDKRLSLKVLILLALSYFLPSLIGHLLVAALLIFSLYRESNPCTLAKKPLVWTMRAKRIALLAWILSGSIVYGMSYLIHGLMYQVIALLVFIHSIPVLLWIANTLLMPTEWFIQRYYLVKALKKLYTLKPKIIAITGSYGKTSTKHILGHVLSQHAPTLITPGSVNTLMGICRIILNQLTPEHQYFIIEMGAYYPQSIAKLCRRLVPQYGIITAIGVAHLERFKSREAILHAKLELANAVEANQGIMVINLDDIFKDEERNKIVDRENYICYSQNQTETKASYKLIETQVTPSGLSLSIQDAHGKDQSLKISVYGKQQAMNIVAVYAMSHVLNVPPPIIKAALTTVPQIDHRLQVIPIPHGPTIIDDAYNANPDGFLSALEVLAQFGQNARRILVTPGLIELGHEHAETHFMLGQKASEFVNFVLIVHSQRIPTFTEGLLSLNKLSKESIIHCEDFQQAKAWVNQHAKPGDAVLYANDLPDLYETTLDI